jgi:NAD(P)-dependent dehydrogenase (short-subunit alcohol dehydrogenase family)
LGYPVRLRYRYPTRNEVPTMTDQRVVFITGCSSGIGRALAEEFIRRGHKVVATARQESSLEGLDGPDVLLQQLDVTVGASIRRAVAAALGWAGRIDALVNNAGYGLIGPVAELDPNDVRVQLETNVTGPIALIREVVPGMAAQMWGRIVNIGSVVGVTAVPFGGAYSASKAAIHLLSDALRMELAPFGIGVVEVQPGSIRSRFGDNAARGVDRYSQEGSLYRPVAAFIEGRARASQSDPSPPEQLARRVADAALRRRPPAVLRYGRNSFRVPLIGRLPVRLRDRFLSRRFGLDRLRG